MPPEVGGGSRPAESKLSPDGDRQALPATESWASKVAKILPLQMKVVARGSTPATMKPDE